MAQVYCRVANTQLCPKPARNHVFERDRHFKKKGDIMAFWLV
jgi:hypothetical protein